MNSTRSNTKLAPHIPIEQSNIIKAIAMLLIVLGHNHILAPYENMTELHLFEYLYSFHVSLFFILPFFYGKKSKLDRNNLSKTIVRNGVPYIIFFTFGYLVTHVILGTHGHFSISEFLGGIIDAPGCRNSSGFVFLWFLPVFMLVSIIRMLGDKYKWMMAVFSIIGIIICVNGQAYVLMWHSPFFILKALFYYAMGFCCYCLGKYIKHMDFIGLAVFVILSVLYWTDTYHARTFYFSISGFFAIKWVTGMVDFSKIKMLNLIGKYSLCIYLIHVFIYNVLERLIPNNCLWGAILYIATIGISLLLSIVIYKMGIARCLFPKTAADLAQSLKLEQLIRHKP